MPEILQSILKAQNHFVAFFDFDTFVSSPGPRKITIHIEATPFSSVVVFHFVLKKLHLVVQTSTLSHGTSCISQKFGPFSRTKPTGMNDMPSSLN